MREYFQVISYCERLGVEDVVDTFTTYEEAERCLFQCQEGDDKHDPCEYYIDSTSVAD